MQSAARVRVTRCNRGSEHLGQCLPIPGASCLGRTGVLQPRYNRAADSIDTVSGAGEDPQRCWRGNRFALVHRAKAPSFEQR